MDKWTNYIIEQNRPHLGWSFWSVVYGDRPKLARKALNGARKRNPTGQFRIRKRTICDETLDW